MLRRLFVRNRGIPLLAITVFLGFTGGAVTIVQAVLLARITDRAFLGGWGLDALVALMLLLLGCIGVRMALQALAELAASQMAQSIKNELRKQLVRHLRELGPAAIKKERKGELLSTIIEGVEQLDIYLAKYVPQIAMSVFMPVAVFVLVAGIDGFTAFILAFTFPLLIVFMILIGKGTKAYTDRQWRTLSLLSGHFMDVVKGLTSLKLFNRSKHQLDVIARISEEHRSATMKTLRIAFLSAFVMELFATLCTAVVAVFLGLRLISGGIGFERAFLVLLLTPEFYLPIRVLGTQFHAGASGVSAAKRIFDLLDLKPMGWPEKDVAKTIQSEGSYEVQFEGVGLAYPETDRDALSDISFTLRPGEKLVIIGATGAGKSTLLELLLGFVRPSKGTIMVNSLDLAELSIGWWRKQISYVGQHAHLFAGSVIDNIRLGRPDASMEEVVTAAKQARADEFITQLPEGYETLLGEEAKLSGGQMTRLVLARAFLMQTPIVLLDEPTAQLDLDTEAALQQSLEQLARGRTMVIVAHRLGITSLADRIIVLDQGRIAEYGTPNELMRRGGKYARMMRAAI